MTVVRPNQDISGVVLDGGRGTRMGGVNKGLVRFQERYLFEYSVANLRHHTDTICINSNTDHERFRELGFHVFGDIDYFYQGPLAGIYSAMCVVDTPYVAIAPCDQLWLPTHVYAELITQARQHGGAFAVSEHDLHPTCAVLSVALLASVRQSLDAHQLRLGVWMSNHAVPVTFSGIDFQNVNTLEI